MRVLARALLVVTAIFLFILSLQMLKRGAGSIMPLLDAVRAEGVLNAFGLGWLLAYIVLSGSPVAATALALFGARQISAVEALGMIAGSRFGAAFVVLLAGILYSLRRRRGMGAVATGILCLLVTWSVYAPATVIGYLLLASGALDGLRLPAVTAVTGLVEVVYDPIVHWAEAAAGPTLLFVAGMGALVASFSLFDRALPSINPEHSRFRQIAFVVYRPNVMFLLGIAVTCMTLSVSVSLGLLVPLSAKGYVRRENIVPYIMGANISTFLDTLVVAVLVGDPRALSVVMAEMLSVILVSLIILLGFYAAYRDGIEWCLSWATMDRRAFLVFSGLMMLVPLLMMVW
ncbi:MAG TPA: hypothetical protein VJV23_02870 [Candidatus Polarisedimenticolia bacterium]|nr:hypothetical protein [Candidatus Polarisedimenticolia bacterium]